MVCTATLRGAGSTVDQTPLYWLPFWSTSHFSLAVEEIQSLAPLTYQGRKPLPRAHKSHSQQLLGFPNSKVRVAGRDTQDNGCKDKEKLWKRVC